MNNPELRLISRMLAPAAMLLLAGTLLVSVGYLLAPGEGVVAPAAIAVSSVGMITAIASAVEAVRAFIACQQWWRGRGEVCPECGAPVVAPLLAVLPFRCLADKGHRLD